MALRSVARLERRGGFRPRLFDGRSRRDFLRYQMIARIQGTEGEPGGQEPCFGEVQDESREPGLQGRRAFEYEVYKVQDDDPHERLERLLRRAVHGAGEGPE